MAPTPMAMRAVLVCAARRSLQRAQQPRSFHASAAALARASRRTGRTAKPSASIIPNPFADYRDGDEDGDDDDEEEVTASKSKKKAVFFTREELEENPNLLTKMDEAMDDDDDEEEDEETKEFLKDVDEMFMLDAKNFGRRLVKDDGDTEDFRVKTRRDHEDYDDDENESDDGEDEVENDIDRAERIPRKRLLKVLDDFDATKPRSGKNAEKMHIPKTKNAAPLEKKTKKADPERISHRQEKIEISVTGFVQNLLLEDSDMTETDVFAHIVEASVSPDLRRVVLYWEPARRNSTNQTIAKKKAEGVQKRLERLEKWVRISVTRHLNLKYSPIVQFKRRKESKSDENRALFDREMAWLDRFKN